MASSAFLAQNTACLACRRLNAIKSWIAGSSSTTSIVAAILHSFQQDYSVSIWVSILSIFPSYVQNIAIS
jgi:hypothetical protein